MAKLDPHEALQRFPLVPSKLQDRRTPAPDTFVLCHLGVVRLSPEDWTLRVEGLVERR